MPPTPSAAIDFLHPSFTHPNVKLMELPGPLVTYALLKHIGAGYTLHLFLSLLHGGFSLRLHPILDKKPAVNVCA